ncbi:MAG: hypothetical protein JWO06_2132 [Bacteroidota bacterium]|nr:hypothetical protein [Bacteroidota bacterium]
MRHHSFKNLVVALLVLAVYHVSAQTDIAAAKHKKCILRGKWQLVQTFTEGSLHTIPKADYDAVISFKPFHRYKEEVNYESYHWVIEGKWHVFKDKATLALTQRVYSLGKMEESPTNIIFELFILDKNNWAGSSTAKGKPVKMYYSKFHRSHN